MLLQRFFDQSTLAHPDKEALVCGATRVSYADLARRAMHIAHALSGCGVKRGDRVALFLDNSIEMVASVLAVLRVGGVFMPINPLTKTDKLAYMLNDSGAAVLVTQPAFQHVWRGALEQSPVLGHCLVAQAPDAAWQPADPRCIRLLPPAPQALVASLAEPEYNIDQDLAAIIYTSGSTGSPKGVMLTHLNMVSATRSIATYLELRSDDRIVCALPLSFDYGLYQVLMTFFVGATLVLETSFTFPVKVLQSMEREKVTVFPGVPTVFSMLMALKTLPEFDLRHLRTITNTAAALSEEHISQLRALFPQARLFSMYGLTECKRVTYLPPEQLDIRPTSVGRGMPNEEVWLVDDAGNRLPNGSTGELVIRGSNVMRGYWNKPAETAACLKPGPLPGEMVLYSGDLFRTDAEGWLYFVARKDDIIKSRGEKVSPKEVENVIYSLEGVQDVAVIGVPDDLLGQAIKAFVVPREGAKLVEKDVLRHCQARLESFMVPKLVEIVPSLPKTDTGKIRKTGLS